MKKIWERLLFRLTHRGVSGDEAPRFIRDVLTIVEEGEHLTLKVINRRLALLGWQRESLDLPIFELIVHYVEMQSHFGGTGRGRTFGTADGVPGL